MTPAPTDNNLDASEDKHPSLSGISVYDIPVHHQTGLLHVPEPPPVHEFEHKTSKLMTPVALVIILLLLFYGFLLYQGIPQNWTKNTNAPIEIAETQSLDREIAESTPKRPPLFMIAPFLGLLLCIAFLPLVPVTEAWWEHNANKLLVAVGLGSLTLLYYFFGCNFPVEGHFSGHHIVDPAVDGGLAVVAFGGQL
ncbi:MAG: sodium:proton antiporter [Planctomycetaceae bacterium]|nr:sodium:proton antiporter [Planctomycetaceae bacterium]